jgi:S1-C subfamily serine protease
LRAALKRRERPLWLAAIVLLVIGVVVLNGRLNPPPRPLTQEDIDSAVLHTLEKNTLPSTAARAYEAVRGSVVRVRQLKEPVEGEKDIEKAVGTGVVIVDKGIILTNLHVVAGAERVGVVFEDGTEAEADVIGAQPENDLAVIQARTLPDDLVPATLRSTKDLAPGDEVVAIGFPFGIGPSATAGVISGLGRTYVSPDGRRSLSNLIQFDAAVNPGSSGGPLVTADGEVVGIVTGIMNPTEQRVFVGIGFAVPIENAAAAIGLSPF